jgi:hypothetical protein
MAADAVTTKASIAEVARMAASSNLRTQITSFAAQTVPAPFDARSVAGGCEDPFPRAAHVPRRAQDRRRRPNPAPDRCQAPVTNGSTCDRAGGNPERDQRRQHSQGHGQPHDSDRR